jgi:hypothetical protein
MIRSAEEFVRLRTSQIPAEQERAGSDDAPVDVWLAVIKQYPDLREWVAHNKTVPLAVLDRLANDPSTAVRFTVAGKRKLSHELQRALMRDSDSSVRHALACNSRCDATVLAVLASDEEPFVSDAAKKKLKVRSGAL